jgi:hypothetical protein
MPDHTAISLLADYAATLQKLCIPESKSKLYIVWVKRFEHEQILPDILNYRLKKVISHEILLCYSSDNKMNYRIHNYYVIN